jgi:hypothetical protein
MLVNALVHGCRGASFLIESIPTVGVAGDGGGENLDGAVTSEPRIPGRDKPRPSSRPRLGPATSYGPIRLVSVASLSASIRRWLESYRRLLV